MIYLPGEAMTGGGTMSESRADVVDRTCQQIDG